MNYTPWQLLRCNVLIGFAEEEYTYTENDNMPHMAPRQTKNCSSASGALGEYGVNVRVGCVRIHYT